QSQEGEFALNLQCGFRLPVPPKNGREPKRQSWFLRARAGLRSNESAIAQARRPTAGAGPVRDVLGGQTSRTVVVEEARAYSLVFASKSASGFRKSSRARSGSMSGSALS